MHPLFAFLLAMASLTLLVMDQSINTPTADVAIIRIPLSVDDHVRVCVDYRTDSKCLTVDELRTFLKNRKFADGRHQPQDSPVH